MRKVKFSCKVFIRDSKNEIGREGTALVCMRVTLSREKPHVENLGIRVNPKNFNKIIGEVYGCDDEADLNRTIRNSKARANEIDTRYRLSNRQLTMIDFKREFPLALLSHESFYDLYKKHMDYAYDNDVICYNTYRVERTTLNKLKRFSPKLLFSELNKDFLIRFDKFCKKKGNMQNTRWGHFKHIEKYCKVAINEGYLLNNPCDEYTVHSTEGDIRACTQEELTKLINYYNGDKIIDRERDVLQPFLFACFTGLRKSDQNVIKHSNFVGDVLIYSPWKNRRKNPKFVRLRVHPKAIPFIQQEENRVFNRIYADQKANEILKIIQGKAGVQTKLTTHVARHTFATTYLERGGSVVKLQKLMGHANIKDTMRYVHLSETLSADSVSVFDGFMDP
jgi:integrase/recombinase XerD